MPPSWQDSSALASSRWGLFRKKPTAFNRIVYKNTMSYHDFEVHTIWNSRARGYSTDSEEGSQLLGQEFTRVVLGEGSHISAEILDKKIMRAIDGALMKRNEGTSTNKETGYLSIYTTPKGYEGCSAAEWERVHKQTNRKPEKLHYGEVPFAQTVWIREASILENPAYDRAVFEARQRMLDKNAFEEQYLGKMSFKTGRIYAEYDEEKHFVPMPPPQLVRNMRLGVGIDTGTYFGAVLVGIDKVGTKWVLGETYTEQQTINDSLDEMILMIQETLGPVFNTQDFEALKNRIEVWIPDPASQHKMEIMEHLDVALGVPASLDKGKLGLLPSIEKVRDWFESNQIYVVDTCTFTNDQIRKYVWKQTKAAGVQANRAPVIVEPKKEYDHLLDALRFVSIPLHDLGPLEEAPDPITWAEAWEQGRRDRVFGPLKQTLHKAGQLSGLP